MPTEWKVGGDAELGALLPHGLVVVLAVETEGVHPARCAGRVLEIRKRSQHVALHHHRAQPELAHRVVELFDRLLGRGHRNHGHR
jgi:hypothetical protein